MAKAKVNQVNKYSVVSELEDTSNTKFTVNGWQGLVSEIVHDEGFDGTVVFFPGVTFNQLKKK